MHLPEPQTPVTSIVIVRQANHETQYLRFNNSDSANQAIKLLLKQVDVISAVRGTDYHT